MHTTTVKLASINWLSIIGGFSQQCWHSIIGQRLIICQYFNTNYSIIVSHQMYYCIAGKLWRKLSWIGRKKIPTEKNLLRVDCSLVPPKKRATPQISQRKLPQIGAKTQRFPPSKVTILIIYVHVETSRPHKQGLPKICWCSEEHRVQHHPQSMRDKQLFLNTQACSQHLWVLCDIRYRVFIELWIPLVGTINLGMKHNWMLTSHEKGKWSGSSKKLFWKNFTCKVYHLIHKATRGSLYTKACSNTYGFCVTAWCTIFIVVWNIHCQCGLWI